MNDVELGKFVGAQIGKRHIKGAGNANQISFIETDDGLTILGQAQHTIDHPKNMVAVELIVQIVYPYKDDGFAWQCEIFKQRLGQLG